MKKLKILSLKDDVKVLTSVEMKMLRGGSVWCHCYGNYDLYGRNIFASAHSVLF